MDYQDALELIERKQAWLDARPNDTRSTYSVKLKHVTYLKRHPDDQKVLVVELFGKDIMFYHPDGRIILDDCTWRTVTTKQRFNEYLPSPWHVWQQRSIWFIAHGWWGNDDQKKWVYDSPLTVWPKEARVEGAMSDEQYQEMRKLDRKIGRYARAFVNALFKGNVPAPSAGDCWYCSMRHSDDNLPLGESMDTLHPDGTLTRERAPHHLLSHMEEKYYVPSLLTRAIEVFPKVSRAARWNLHNIWYGNGEEKGFVEDLCKRQITTALRSYMRQQLGLPF
jgi:hypothetical protein